VPSFRPLYGTPTYQCEPPIFKNPTQCNCYGSRRREETGNRPYLASKSFCGLVECGSTNLNLPRMHIAEQICRISVWVSLANKRNLRRRTLMSPPRCSSHLRQRCQAAVSGHQRSSPKPSYRQSVGGPWPYRVVQNEWQAGPLVVFTTVSLMEINGKRNRNLNELVSPTIEGTGPRQHAVGVGKHCLMSGTWP